MARMTSHYSSPRADVVSMGCRLNLAEGEAMKRALSDAGAADIVIVNTCGVTNEAARQSRQTIRKLRRERPQARLFVTGCAAQIDQAAFAAMPEVDAVVGNASKLEPQTWAALASAPRAAEPILMVDDIMSVRTTAPQLMPGYGDRSRAFLQVQNGCDHRCTFCAIPYGRGNARSAPVKDVIAQARALADAGHDELVLTGVDITSWGTDLTDRPALGALVSAVLDAVPEVKRLRLSSIDGAELDDELFDRLTGDDRLAPHVHLSVQAGDDMILKRMKRRHSRSDVIGLTARLRARRPDIAVGADIIAGFPTETEEMFRNSLRLIDEAGLNFLHVFPFSPRKGTPAARMPQVDRAVIKERARRLRAKGSAATNRFLASLVGRQFDGVVETGGAARLGNFASVRLLAPPPSGLTGRLTRIDVVALETDRGLTGRIAAPRSATE
ncbi:MAG: tRNA (N(6)-L-threonylcarbamoyladenosine(37)-C(2))-methylthiotransferase MtaB [Pseudomonadota bacterium]